MFIVVIIISISLTLEKKTVFVIFPCLFPFCGSYPVVLILPLQYRAYCVVLLSADLMSFLYQKQMRISCLVASVN